MPVPYYFSAVACFFDHPDGTRCPANSGAPACLVAFGAHNVEALRRSGLAGILVEQWVPVIRRIGRAA
jgi:hypothetical protein